MAQSNRDGLAERFAYRAIAADGTRHDGVLVAGTRDEVLAVLGGRGLFALEIAQPTQHTRKRRVSYADLGLGLRLLADLLEAGLPMTRALQALQDIAPAPWRAVLPQMRESVKEGRGLATTLARAEIDIPPMTVAIIHAGEAGAGLGGAIRRAADIAESAAATRSSIRSALAYPMIVAVAGICAVGVLLGVVLPRFASILNGLGQTLPASTQAVLALSNMIRAGFVPGCLIGSIIVVAYRGWTGTESGRRSWHGILLALPVIGPIRRATATSRACASLGALLDTGVPMATAIKYSARAAGDAAVEARIHAAWTHVARGEPLAVAFEQTGAVTATASRLIRAGEQTGRLASMLGHAAKLEYERADRTVRVGVRLLEPLLLMVFATFVAGVAASLLQAIYSVKPG
jgi:type II secretory pathway component PulF